jgi:hypothetical protein
MSSRISFLAKLGRLKEALAVAEDRQVAELLGMTPAAFAMRKQRGAFPDRDLMALSSLQPDLKLDLVYVLTGHRWDPSETTLERALVGLAASEEDSRYLDSALASISNQEELFTDALRLPAIRSLIRVLASCDDRTIEKVLDYAMEQMGEAVVPFRQRASWPLPEVDQASKSKARSVRVAASKKSASTKSGRRTPP